MKTVLWTGEVGVRTGYRGWPGLWNKSGKADGIEVGFLG